MRRRDFIKGVAGSAITRPLAARAQQAGKLATIGVLGTDATVWSPRTAAFVERLRELGWIEGRTIAIEYRWAEGRPERVAEIATKFVRQKVDIIVTYGGAVATINQATSVIPIVFASAGDPIAFRASRLIVASTKPGFSGGLSIAAAPELNCRKFGMALIRTHRCGKFHPSLIRD